ncbi:polyadenylate-binding protein-interacting protein 2 isoform X2 [Carlito syrichta]|uniref:Polyadenylate-binding protein-interacting protein 2 isoform X2 n=1 Tax=Carlito syrichta TaxID=1868482 RepID=A0A3Q0DWR1_CARSF|nr:polyadenylate-binding protein-interacting protein 2 isoform X2 [Carlito syrichta]
MKDPSRSSTSPSIINEDVIINGHSHEDDNPFAEYMWMENEEEFNRQKRSYGKKNLLNAVSKKCWKKKKSMSGLFQLEISHKLWTKSKTNLMTLLSVMALLWKILWSRAI